MKTIPKDILKTEQYIKFLRGCETNKSINIPVKFSYNGKTYKSKLKSIEYHYFMQSGDHCYFISRTLFLQYLCLASFFFGQQCIENYLKAFLKFKIKNEKFEGHDLVYLLNECKKIANKSFLNTKNAEIIIKKLDPFNELPRYPVQKHEPKQGQYSFLVPDDIYILDYFIYKMRKELTIRSNTWDMLKIGFPYKEILIKDNNPRLIKLFKQNNINFN